MEDLLQLKTRDYLQSQFQNYAINPDTYLKSLGKTNQVNYDRYTAPRNLTTSQQFQLLLLDLIPHLGLKIHWKTSLNTQDWLDYCHNLIQKAEKIQAESNWWFSGIFKTQDLEEITETLKKVLVYKLTQLYHLLVADYKLLRSFLWAMPPQTLFDQRIFLSIKETQIQEIAFQEKLKIIDLTLPSIDINPNNQFKALLDAYVVYELQAVEKIVLEAKVNRQVCRQDLKVITQNFVQSIRSHNQIKTETRQKAGLLEFDFQLKAMGWVTAIKENSTSVTQHTIRFLKFTAPLTAAIGGLLLLMYLL